MGASLGAFRNGLGRWGSLVAVGAVTLLGAALGFVTILLGSVTTAFVEVLVSTTVTIYGFLIIGLIFVYEQQRRSWPVMWNVRDSERVALRVSFVIGLVTGVSGLVLGVSLLALDPGGNTTLWARIGLDASAAVPLLSTLRRLDWLVAPLSVTSVVVLIHAVRRVLILLSPRSMSERVVQAARRAARAVPFGTSGMADDDERVQETREWVDALQRLTVEHLVSRDIEQYEAHVRSLGELAQPWTDGGRSLAEGFLTSIAVERLITVADRAGGERDPKIYALDRAIRILTHQSAVERIGPRQRIEHAERVALLLDDALAAARPSATVSASLLRLGLVLYPTQADRAEFIAGTLRDALPIRRPADVWSAVSRVLSEEIAAGRNGLGPLEVAAAVSALAVEAIAPDRSRSASGVDSDGRSHAERVLDLFESLGVEPASMHKGVAQPRLRAVMEAYAWILTEAEGSADLDKSQRHVLLHRFALLWRATKADIRQELQPDLRDIIERFSPTDWTFIRFVAGIEEMRAKKRPSAVLNSRNFRRDEQIGPEEVRDATQMVLDTYRDQLDPRWSVEAMRGMLARDRRYGMMALPTFVLLRDAVESFVVALRTDGDLEPYRATAAFIDIGPAATEAKYFNRGLEDCKWVCFAETHAALNVLTGQLPTVLSDSRGDPRLRQARGLFRALGLSVFALAVSINDALGLFTIGRFVEAVPSFASLPRSEEDAGEWTQHQLLRLTNDALWVTNIVMDMPILIAPRKAGVRRDASADRADEEGISSDAYVLLPDGSRALRMRDVWRLAALRKVLLDIDALVAHVAEVRRYSSLAALRRELEGAVLLGGNPGNPGDVESLASPDHLERILAEAIVSMRRHHYWSWTSAVARLDWRGLGPAVWAEAAARLGTVKGDSLEPSGVMGLVAQMVMKLDGERMPNEARIFLAEMLQHDLPHLGRVDAEAPFNHERVGSFLAKALEIVTHRRVYDKDLHAGAVATCVAWADRTRHRGFARVLSRQLTGRTERNPLLIALQHALVTNPGLSCWDWRELQPAPNWRQSVRRAKTQSALARLGVGARVDGTAKDVRETRALVDIGGATAELPASELGWMFIPDLRLLLRPDQGIDLLVTRARTRQSRGGRDDPELILSRKALTPDPRPALRAAIDARTRQDAVYLGLEQRTKRAFVQLIGFEDLVVAVLVGATFAALPKVGSAMRVLVRSMEQDGHVTATP